MTTRTEAEREAVIADLQRCIDAPDYLSNDIVDAMKRAIALLRQPVEQWQPIESAPKSGKKILLAWPKHGIVASGRYDIDENFDERPRGWPSPAEGWRNDGDQCIPKNQADCTHWQPLPESPQ